MISYFYNTRIPYLLAFTKYFAFKRPPSMNVTADKNLLCRLIFINYELNIQYPFTYTNVLCLMWR